MNYKRIILYFLPAILVTCIIFFLSSRDSTASNVQSGEVTQSLLNILGSKENSSNIDLATTEGFHTFYANEAVGILNQFIRSLAHISEFGGLGLMILLGSHLLKLSRRSAYKLTLVWGTLVAVCDEILQYFVPGRTCSMMDIFKDVFGICAAILCVHIGCKMYSHYQLHKTLSLKKTSVPR